MNDEYQLKTGKERKPDSLVSIAIIVMDYQLRYFDELLSSIEHQTYESIEIVIIDKTAKAVVTKMVSGVRHTRRVEIIAFPDPAGFAHNNNIAISRCTGDFVFILNLDTRLDPTCIEELTAAMYLDESIGCVSPKLLRMDPDQNVYEPPVIDSAGMYITRILRHMDRGSGQVDVGQFDEKSYVFGVTGAGAFFRTGCLKDIEINGQYFDEDFWSYREDADISWRLQNYGWRCLYTPKAVVYHVRTLKPGKRSGNSTLANMHSVKNRYLLLINNISLRNYIRYFPFIFLRDIVVVGGVLIKEHRSFQAFTYLLKNMRKLLAKRRLIQVGVNNDVSSFWFNHKSITFYE